MKFRTGSGFDVHRIGPGTGIWLGGVYIECGFSLIGHSDADVLIHALCDAIYGSIAEGDIGVHFPDNSEENRGRKSSDFLIHASGLLARKGFALENADITVICERPRIGPHRPAIRDSLSKILNVPPDLVSVKATTTEKLGFTGRGEGIAVMASVLVSSSA